MASLLDIARSEGHFFHPFFSWNSLLAVIPVTPSFLKYLTVWLQDLTLSCLFLHRLGQIFAAVCGLLYPAPVVNVADSSGLAFGSWQEQWAIQRSRVCLFRCPIPWLHAHHVCSTVSLPFLAPWVYLHQLHKCWCSMGPCTCPLLFNNVHFPRSCHSHLMLLAVTHELRSISSSSFSLKTRFCDPAALWKLSPGCPISFSNSLCAKQNSSPKERRPQLLLALFKTLSKMWEQPKCPLTDKRVEKMWCVYTHTHTHTHWNITWP